MAWPVLGLEVFLAAISDLLDTAVKQYTYFLDVIKSNSRRRLENPLLIFHLRQQFRRGAAPLRYGLIFFVRVGHETTYVSSKNKHFIFSIYLVIVRPTKIIKDLLKD